jgi:hypothetical protein
VTDDEVTDEATDEEATDEDATVDDATVEEAVDKEARDEDTAANEEAALAVETEALVDELELATLATEEDDRMVPSLTEVETETDD